ncbi:putative mitochondrial -like protein [Trichinella sp. T6]|nr:putative mitochondrial -like protein [Trichinella sp. T6]
MSSSKGIDIWLEIEYPCISPSHGLKHLFLLPVSVNLKRPQPHFLWGRPRTDASVWLARTEQCLEQNGIPRDRGTSVACSFLSDDVYVQLLSIVREADLANQHFPTDAAHAAVVRATAGNECVQPTPSLDEETADSRCAISVVRADTSSDMDRLVEALRRVLTEEIHDPIMPPHQQHRRAYHRPTAARPRESRCYNYAPSSGATDHNYHRIIDEMLPSVEELDTHSRNALRSVLWKYRRCIATSDEDLGHTELASHRIDARNAAPVKVPPRRLPPTQRHDVQRMVTGMFSRLAIGPANSPWSALIVTVRKKDGSPRFCVDFRRLNDVTTEDAHPLPRIVDTLEALSGALAHGCRTSRTYVVVLPCIPRRHYRLWRTTQEHTDRLERVLQQNGVSTDAEKIRAVKEWPTPCCPSEVRQFLGLASYYRRFIKNFSMVSTPLNALLRKGSHWKWTADCQTAFDQLWSIKEFRPYLYAHEFDVRTGHSCLRWLRNFKEPEGQVARWLEQLAEYDFSVLHRPGRAWQS